MTIVTDNTTPATGPAALRRFKDQLVSGASWVCRASSFGAKAAYNGGTTYASGDKVSNGGVDYVSLAGANTGHAPPNATWWAVIDYTSNGDEITTDSGVGSLANVGAWMCLRMPGTGANGTGYREICVQQGAGATSPWTWRVTYAPQGFTGGSPGTLRTPSTTATNDSVILIGAGTEALPTCVQLLPADASYRWTIAMDTASPYYAMAVATIPGTPLTTGGIFVLPFRSASYPTAELDPYAVGAIYHSSVALTHGQISAVRVFTTGSDLFTYYEFGGASVAKVHKAWAGWLPGGSALGTQAQTGQELPIEIAWGTNTGGNGTGAKGYLNNVWGCGSTTTQTPHLQRLQMANGRYAVRAGDLWLEYDSSVPT